LVVKKALLTNRVPAMPGGGTVVYVTPEDHVFTTDLERKEEGGTPAIVESVRAGLVFALQQQVGTETIEAREEDFVRRALDTWKQSPNVDVLGNTEADRLAIVSLRIKHDDKFLHYGFVAALLNDVFGIQARGGCSCAGPYGHTLLGMDMAYSKAVESEILNGNMLLRPGWVRVNFNYFIDEKTYQYIVDAIALISQHGWRLLPFYQFDEKNGVWRYQGEKINLPSDLKDFFKVAQGETLVKSEATYLVDDLAEYLAIGAKELLGHNKKGHDRQGTQYAIEQTAEVDKLRWFTLPQDITAKLSTEHK